MWILIILAVLCVLLISPLRIIARYSADSGCVYVRYGLLRWTVYPTSKTDRDGEKDKKASGEKQSGEPTEQNAIKLIQVIRILKMILEPLNYLRRQIRIDRFDFRLVLTNDDPCDLAILYGRVWAVASDLQALINRIFKIKKQNVDIQCEYLESQTTVEFFTSISIPAICLLWLIVRYGFKIFKEFQSIKNEGKGGINNEQESS